MSVIRIIDLPALGQPLAGGIFAGLITRPDGAHGALVLLADKPAALLSWLDAMAWAASVGGELPSRPEAALLFANLKDQFEEHWHWTREELDGSYAWLQYFGNGSQGNLRKGFQARARAVRFIPLESA